MSLPKWHNKKSVEAPDSMKKRRTVGTFLPPEQPQNNPEGVSQRVARNLFWLILDKMVALANALVIGALVARYLGPAGFGLLGTALAVWIIASNIAEGGLRKVVVRKMVIAPDGTKQLLGAGLRLRFLLSAAILLLLYALIFGTSWIATGPLERAVFALVLAGLLVEPLRVADYLIEARLLGYVEARTTTLTLLLLAALRVTLVVGEAPLLAFAGAMLLEQISIAVFRFLLAGRATGVWPASSLLAGQSWRLLKASSPMLLSGLFVSLYMYVDLPMLRALAGMEGRVSTPLPFASHQSSSSSPRQRLRASTPSLSSASKLGQQLRKLYFAITSEPSPWPVTLWRSALRWLPLWSFRCSSAKPFFRACRFSPCMAASCCS